MSVHTSPLAQPGTGDAGGMNVYVLNTALELAQRGIDVEIFTRATSSHDEPIVQLADGVTVRNIVAGPFEGLDKADLPTQLCPFTAEVLRAEIAAANRVGGYFDIVHSHYWLSGQVGWLARDRWNVPLVHTAHTLAAVKNAALADGDRPEPASRYFAEQQIVDEADRLVVNTATEARQLATFHDANLGAIDVVPPGVDLSIYRPGSRRDARQSLGLSPSERIVTFVGRIQPLKAPDLVLKAVAELPNRADVRVLVVGGPSGSGLAQPDALIDLTQHLGIADRVTFLAPQPAPRLAEIYRASDVVVVPSHNESFGLVAMEAQACGTPVIASAVGGLRTAVRDAETGLLLASRAVRDWADAIDSVLEPGRGELLGAAAAVHAQRFSWQRTADGLVRSYTQARRDYSRQISIADGVSA